jgi:nucleolar protein 6
MAITKRDKDPTRAERKLKKRKLEEAIPDLPGDVGATDLQDASTPAIEGQENKSKKRKLGKTSIHDVDIQQDGANGTQQRKNKEERKEKRKGKKAPKDNESYGDEILKSIDKASGSDHINEIRSGELESIHGKLERETEVLRDSTALIDEEPPAKKSKKERKAERKATEAAQAAASNNSAPASIEDTPVAVGEEVQSGMSKKNNRNREKKQKGYNSNEASEKAEGKAPRFIVFIGKLHRHFACSYN